MRIVDSALVALVGVTAITGLRAVPEGVVGWPPASVWQRSVLVAQILYVVAGAAGLAGWRRRRPWVFWTLVVWALSSLAAGTIATRAFGGGSWSSVAATMLGSLLVIAPVLFRVYRRSRGVWPRVAAQAPGANLSDLESI
jgi:hypothetical protein